MKSKKWNDRFQLVATIFASKISNEENDQTEGGFERSMYISVAFNPNYKRIYELDRSLENSSNSKF